MQSIKHITLALLCVLVASSSSHVLALTIEEQSRSITAEGQKLASLLDSLDVEHNWAKSQHISWFGGQPNNVDRYASDNSTATHCSAFAAAVAERLGVPLLRPPQHSQTLLANDQYGYIKNTSTYVTDSWRLGWRITTDLIELQAAANKGMFAVIVKQNTDLTKPGHIAVVRPNGNGMGNNWLWTKGPQITQSGSVNYNNITASSIFTLNATNVIYAIFDRPDGPQIQLPFTLYRAGTKKIYYAVDVGKPGRIDAYKLEYTTNTAVWKYAHGATGKSNNSAWADWYLYKDSTTSTYEPFSLSKSSYATFTISPGALSVKDGTTLYSPATALTTTAVVDGITGAWYASIDDQFHGIFITNSTATKVGGFAFLYNTTMYAEFHTLDLTWTTPNSVATGKTLKCVWGSSMTCTRTSATDTSVVLTINADTKVGTITGLPGVTGSGEIEKATFMDATLGPV